MTSNQTSDIPRSVTMWAIYLKGYKTPVMETIKCRRRDSIRRLTEIRKPFVTWKQARELGYRAVRVKISKQESKL